MVSSLSKKEGQKKDKKQKDNNKELYRIMYVFCGLFLLLCGYLSYFLVFKSREAINNPYNLRQESMEKKIVRGKILAAGGEVLAETVLEEGKEKRVYPYQDLFSHVVGYSIYGRSGIEQKYNFELLTSDIPFYEKLYGEFMGKKDPGDQLVTTLSLPLQQAAYNAMGEMRGAVVVLEPSTGKVLAMVSKPGFDPNKILEQWDQWNSEENTESVLLNRATQGLYPPGSTFKILTALEYIRENPSAMEDFTYQCNGIFSYHNAEINCYHGKSHGTLDFTSAFAKSCNGAFAKMGIGLSIPGWNRLCQAFLFQPQLSFPLACEPSQFVLAENAPEWEIMQTAIGQGKTEVTPLHNALIAAAVANGGVLMKPYIISEIQTAYGATIKQFFPSVYDKVMSTEEAEILSKLMAACVVDGTGYAAYTDKYTVAGKTGTAEWEKQKEPHSWFVGFAPVENPQIVVSVILEEAGAGSEYAVPVAKKIWDAYFMRD